MEKEVVALPKDLDEMSKEVLEVTLDLALLLLVDKSVDSLASAEAIGPFLHLESLLQLEVAKIKQLDHGIIVIQAHWPGNFVCALVLGLVGLDNLQKVRMKRVRETKVLLAAVKLLCKLEEMHSYLVV